MTVDPTADQTQMPAEVAVAQEAPNKVVDEETKEVVVLKQDGDEEPDQKAVEKSSSYREESNFLSDLKEFERKALNELRSKLEDAILGNALFSKPEEKKKESPTAATEEKGNVERDKKDGEDEKEEEQEKKDGEEEGRKAGDDKCGGPEVEVHKDVSLWGVPLLPSKGAEETNVVLLKFLRARDFKVNDAFEMLKKTLQWRKESNVDSVGEEAFDADLNAAAYLSGTDREGHPVCYNVYGVFGDDGVYQKAFGTEGNRSRFLRWRVQRMEEGIRKLDLKPGGVSSLLQINDLKNSPGPSKKELRIATKQAINLLQDNYPELVARNIFINVPFWYYALTALISPFLTQRTKSKFLVARPAKVTETLLKYIPAEEIPVQYGGFKRETDFEFSSEDGAASELTVKAGATEAIEILLEEAGRTLVWDIAVLGWEVNYKEEFVPSDEGSYTVIVQKGKKMGASRGPTRNTFRNSEPGKIVLTIENVSTKRKRVLYRYKNTKGSSL